MGKIRAFSKRKRWSDQEISILREHYEKTSRSEILKMLEGRTNRQIECKANWLGLKRVKKPKMTAEERRESKRLMMERRRKADPEKTREYNRAHHHKRHDENKAKMRGYYARRFFWAKAMKLRGENRATYRDLASIWRSQRGLCALTGRKLDRTAEPDHIVPKAKGGGDEKSNLRWVCKAVNRMKRDMLDDEFILLCSDVMQLIGQRIQMVSEIPMKIEVAA